MTGLGAYETSYFSTPSATLDPTLFQGRHLQSWVRQGIVALLNDFLSRKYLHAELWTHPWLAGSGVSYQWSAARQPADLDCLVGVNFVQFRKANPAFTGLSDKEIAAQLNEEFRSELQPDTENWHGYELTFYVNPTATDIRSIKPYAAYDLKYDEWTVTPSQNSKAPSKPEWQSVAHGDAMMTNQVVTRFTTAKNDLTVATNPAARRNAETRLWSAGAQGNALFNEIHDNRALAFSANGEGYNDFHNYRWQAGKSTGAIQALRTIRENMKGMLQEKNSSTYGVEFPDSATLIRRAALQRNEQ
jgi:hypothetical protein